MRKKIFNEQEEAILSALPRSFKFIAREEDGTLCIFESKPKRERGMWVGKSGTRFYSLPMFTHLFTIVQWENKGPLEFREVLEVRSESVFQ